MNCLLPRVVLASLLLPWIPDVSGQAATPPKSEAALVEARAIPVERVLAVSGQGYFPVALRLRDGRIAAVLRGGGPHLSLAGRLDMIFSSDDGKTWSKPALVVDSPLDDRNPAFGQADDGTLVVGFWRTANYDEKGSYNPKLGKSETTWVTRSQDGGQTWSEPAEIDVSDIGSGSPYGRIITMPDGAMLMPIYGNAVRPAGEKLPGERSHSYVYRSTDRGQTWTRFSEVGDGKEQLNETSILRLPDGKILAAARTRGSELRQTVSADDGRTWSPLRPLAPANIHPADLCLLPDGRVLLTMGNRVGPLGVIGIVGDAHGQFDWEKRFALVTDAVSRDCGYPSSVALPEDRALTLYYATAARDHPEWRVHAAAVVYQPPAP
jgi:photosystem II stability/assembly factor-like uncharacterized protein